MAGGIRQDPVLGFDVIEVAKTPDIGFGAIDIEGALKRSPSDRLGAGAIASGLEIVDPGAFPGKVGGAETSEQALGVLAWRVAAPRRLP